MTPPPTDRPSALNQTRGLDHEQLGHGPSALDSHSLDEVRAIARAAGVENADEMTKDQLVARLNPATQAPSGDAATGSPAPPPAAPDYAAAHRANRPTF